MDAFAALFEPLRARIHAVAYRLVGPDDAEDVVMDTFLKAWQALPTYAERSSLSTWLCGIARHQALDLLRKRAVRQRGRAEAREEEDALAGAEDVTQPSPTEAIERSEDSQWCARALTMLPEPHRQALLLRYVDGLSYREISSALNISVGTTMSRLFNAKRKLRELAQELTLPTNRRIKDIK